MIRIRERESIWIAVVGFVVGDRGVAVEAIGFGWIGIEFVFPFVVQIVGGIQFSWIEFAFRIEVAVNIPSLFSKVVQIIENCS